MNRSTGDGHVGNGWSFAGISFLLSSAASASAFRVDPVKMAFFPATFHLTKAMKGPDVAKHLVLGEEAKGASIVCIDPGTH